MVEQMVLELIQIVGLKVASLASLLVGTIVFMVSLIHRFIYTAPVYLGANVS